LIYVCPETGPDYEQDKKITEMKRIVNPELTYWYLVIFFVIVKLMVHRFTYNNFELHRDAYLYYAQGEHLAWGYFSASPATALLARVATMIFGNTTFALRLFPALIGGMNIIVAGLAVKELGGGKAALSLAALAFILSPAYLHVNSLFQPVSLNQFYWFLSGYLVLLMVKRNNPVLWIWLGIVFGLAFLNKYSIVFFYSAIGFSLLVSQHRKIFLSRFFPFSILIALVIIGPNIAWQWHNNWPVIDHMSQLRDTQLVHVKPANFIKEQVLMNLQALILWAGALVILLFSRAERQYRIFGITYLVLVVLMLAARGKSYYTLGVYPLMFVFGGFFAEKYIRRCSSYIFSLLIMIMFVSLYLSLPFDGVPLITFEKAIKKDAFRWEDGEFHDLPQDMADMTGWKELGERVKKVYLELDKEKRTNCNIYCYHYGQAGAVMFYGKDIGIPQPISFNGSFVYWNPDSLVKDYVIWVHFDEDNGEDPYSFLSQIFNRVELKETINNPYFRENGTQIYLCEFPTDKLRSDYAQKIRELRSGSR